jgi:DNA repair exonuclease SbcCD ATPase subunit
MSRSKLFINRFAVHGAGKLVYDQEFNPGVNIIRGENGTGKSTIMDLLNYALGAEIADWTVEQQKCEWVAVEISLNGHFATLKRTITNTGQEKIFYLDTTMDEALSSLDGWRKYPMRRNKDTHSFSQHMFELLGLPRHKTDDDKNLTMHQILRLMYVDQLSATTKLLKEDYKFDNVTFRRAIGEYLLGIDDLEAYNLRQELIEANREFEKANGELKAIYRMFGHDESLINVAVLNQDIAEVTKNIEKLNKEKITIRASVPEAASKEVSAKVKELVKIIDTESDKLASLESEKQELITEINETQLFLKSLEERKIALTESQVTYSLLGNVAFEYCPSCLEPLEDTEVEHGCGLCKSTKKVDDKDFAYSQLLNELNFQIKESKKIIATFESDVVKIDANTPSIKVKILAAKTELKDFNVSTDDKGALLQEISTEIGFSRSQILSLEDKREQVSRVESLKRKKDEANRNISKISSKLERISLLQETRHTTVYNAIESKARSLLKLDGGYENEFDNAEDVVFDFARDKMYVNGRSKFSASSMVVMKNSIRFAMFAQSVDDRFSRFPNLILMDNIEDKGMREERSQNFQRQMVDVCSSIRDEFQLIFTTSMIANELDDTAMCVGPSYPKGTHTLEF